MKFVDKFEPMCRMSNDQVVSLGLFDTYEQAHDAAIYQAASGLPTECMKAFQIVKSSVNMAFFEVPERGD